MVIVGKLMGIIIIIEIIVIIIIEEHFYYKQEMFFGRNLININSFMGLLEDKKLTY